MKPKYRQIMHGLILDRPGVLDRSVLHSRSRKVILEVNPLLRGMAQVRTRRTPFNVVRDVMPSMEICPSRRCIPLRHGTIRLLSSRLRNREAGMRNMVPKRRGTTRGSSIALHRVNRVMPVQCMTRQSTHFLLLPFHFKISIPIQISPRQKLPRLRGRIGPYRPASRQRSEYGE